MMVIAQYFTGLSGSSVVSSTLILVKVGPPEIVIKDSQSSNLKRKIFNDSNKWKTKHYQFKSEYSS